ERRNDVLIAAATAAGKTEAAVLPILTKVADRNERGFSVLNVSPLKALINALSTISSAGELCERIEIDVVRWHRDAPQSAKQRTRRDPRGLVCQQPRNRFWKPFDRSPNIVGCSGGGGTRTASHRSIISAGGVP
ncbi:hypothetical protein C9427_33375, partial [Mesorhizobium helmanticense]